MPEQVPGNLFEARMPEVDQPPDIAKVFDKARQAAVGENPGPGSARNVVLVTPGRMLMLQPCPPPGSMPQSAVEQIERLAPSTRKRKIAVIAYTELRAVTGDLAKAIPFFGMLSGMAYIGHAVWIFEGHASALAEGSKDADILIADGAMVPHLAADWPKLARSQAPSLLIYVHDRATHSLRKVD
jgi:hypothetical protein